MVMVVYLVGLEEFKVLEMVGLVYDFENECLIGV